jgi:hypothetical protein
MKLLPAERAIGSQGEVDILLIKGRKEILLGEQWCA